MRHLITLGIGLALLVPVWAPTAAEADLVLCRKGKKLKIREDVCKEFKGEQLVTPEDLGIVSGEPGPPGEPGTARAWAAVNPGASPTLVRSSGFDSVRNGSAVVDGVYCLTLTDDTIDPTDTAPVASVNLNLTNASAVTLDIVILVRAAAFVCSEGEIEVLTGRVDHDSLDATELDLVGDVGFNIAVP
jgi:hypothetical protein